MMGIKLLIVQQLMRDKTIAQCKLRFAVPIESRRAAAKRFEGE